MKQIILIVLLVIFSFSLVAQESCDCQKEMDFLYQEMQTMASFKSQVKGEKKDSFDQVYQQLSNELKGQLSLEECFWKLNKLLNQVKDENAMLFGARPEFGVEEIQDSSFIRDYRNSTAFLNFPRSNKDLEKLETQLDAQPLQTLEGIYSIGNDVLKIGVYRTQQKDSLVGVVLDSKLGTWEAGQLYLYMKERDSEKRLYDIMTYGQVHKNLLFYSKRWVHDHSILTNMRKVNAPSSFAQVNQNASEAYQLKSLNEQVQYLWLNSFSRFGNAEKRDLLIKEIESGLTAKHLIIDLRNNGGGASKISKPILKALKKHLKAKVYVLTNYQSGSNAEQTTLRAKRMLKATHLGERTRGALAYGMNYGIVHCSPSGLFEFMPTDMKFNHWLKYEQVGIEPELKLAHGQDWIEQTLELIEHSQE